MGEGPWFLPVWSLPGPWGVGGVGARLAFRPHRRIPGIPPALLNVNVQRPIGVSGLVCSENYTILES